MRPFWPGFTLVLITFGAAEAAVPQGVDLANVDGWDIIIPADAIPSEKYAAEELQSLLARATGKKLEIASEPQETEGAGGSKHHIYVGAGKKMQGSPVGFSVDGFGPEDLRIVIRDGNIAIAGGRPRGTLYGVYVFAEDYLGVRFLTADHTYVPVTGAWRVVGPVDRFYHPPLSFRWSVLRQPPGSAGDDEEEDYPPEPQAGQQEAPSKEGREMSLSPEEASRLLDGFKLDGERRLPLGEGNTPPPKGRPRPDW